MTNKWSKPQSVTDADITFGGIKNLMPSQDEIPNGHDPELDRWCDLADTWFGRGLDKNILVPKKGIDRDDALRHLSAIMGSWAPKHEHKISAVGYLMSLWFEGPA